MKEKSTIRYKILNDKRVPLCDYSGTCMNKAYREVFPRLLKGKYRNRGWSYLCRKHYYEEQKRLCGKLPSCGIER